MNGSAMEKIVIIRSDYQMMMMSMFSTGTEYDLGDKLTKEDPNHSIQQGAMFDLNPLEHSLVMRVSSMQSILKMVLGM